MSSCTAGEKLELQVVKKGSLPPVLLFVNKISNKTFIISGTESLAMPTTRSESPTYCLLFVVLFFCFCFCFCFVFFKFYFIS